jgi:RNA-splicing ligase RtcB
MPDYEIRIDALWNVVHQVSASSEDAIWEENPEVSKVIDEMLTKLSDLDMASEVEVEWAND